MKTFKTFNQWLAENHPGDYTDEFAANAMHDIPTLLRKVNPRDAAKAKIDLQDPKIPKQSVIDWLVAKSTEALDRKHGVPSSRLPPMNTMANMDRFSSNSPLPSDNLN